MNIGINTRLLLPNKLEGIGWFTYEVVKRIAKNHPEHTFFLFFDRKYDPKFVFEKNCKPIVLHPQARHPILYKIWFDYSIPVALKKHKIDLFFSPDGFLSHRTNVKQVPVIHDLNFEHIPEDLPSKHTRYYKNNFPGFANIATHIITVSEFSKNDIATTYSIPKDKITVAYNGASELYKPLENKEKQHTKNKYTTGCDYFVYVGSLHKRKNIVRMLKAYDSFRKANKSTTKFVIVGEKLFKSDDIDTAYNSMEFKSEVIFTGRLSQKELVNVVASAKGMIYVSYFEGFGIPILETLQCGVPVLTSNVTSLPEVGGDEVLYCDPMQISAISNGIQLLDTTEFDQKKLLRRAQQFSWEKTAKIVWNVLDREMNKE